MRLEAGKACDFPVAVLQYTIHLSARSAKSVHFGTSTQSATSRRGQVSERRGPMVGRQLLVPGVIVELLGTLE